MRRIRHDQPIFRHFHLLDILAVSLPPVTPVIGCRLLTSNDGATANLRRQEETFEDLQDDQTSWIVSKHDANDLVKEEEAAVTGIEKIRKK